MPKSKKFIDRKNAVTFHLVHRSQQDPLQADERAPQRVLLPVNDQSKGDVAKRREEQQKYGIQFDDDYNYLQHLSDVNKTEVIWALDEEAITSKLKLPSSVFASKVEENVGLLNRAAPHSGPRLDLDPDIVAAMDDDFDFDDPENELEDNIVEMLNAQASDVEDEENDDVASLNGSQFSFTEEETKSRFTEYSMTSSVMRRNQQLTLLDDRFEKMYSDYDDEEIGALDCEEIEGFVDPNSEILLQCVDEFEREKKREQLEQDIAAVRLKLSKIEDEDSEEDNEEDLKNVEVKDNKNKWDCESILTTYSNIYNHPKLIVEPKNNPQKIQLHPRTGIPLNTLGKNRLTAKTLSQFNSENDQIISGSRSIGGNSIISQLSHLSIRPKDESPEQRKERKQALKEYRRLRREEKKANSEAFKEETKRQIKITLNNKNNVQGNKIL